MKKEKVLKLQLNAARQELEDLYRLVEGLVEEKRLLMLALKGYVSDNRPPPSAFKWVESTPEEVAQYEKEVDAALGPIDLEKVAAAL